MSAVESTSAGLRGVLRCDEPLARHTAWGIGGPARRFYEPADVADLAAFLGTLAPGEEVFLLGLGSNVLVRDAGIAGTVIDTARLDGLALVATSRVRVEAGVACPKVAKFCASERLGGCEFFAGIPGTMGGALAMNAGAFGGETWDLVTAVETMTRHGELRHRQPSEYRIGYRSVAGPEGELFVAAELELRAHEDERAAARIKELLRLRAETQPLGKRSCGSVFRNPAGDYAARLIEASGLKGMRVGNAMVSTKHANFIINTGGATARDVETLIGDIVERVERESGVRLVPEVRIVGRDTDEEAER